MGLGRCVTSAVERAAHPDRLTVQFYIDDDDAELSLYGEVLEKLRDEYDPKGVILMGHIGDSIGCPRAANSLALGSDTDIVMMCGDDLVFRDDGWDDRLDEDAAKYPDDLFLFWFNEERSRHKFSCFPIVSRRWIETLGYFLPTVFEHYFADLWLMEVACRIGRAHFISDVVVQHLPVSTGQTKDDTWDSRADQREQRFARDEALWPFGKRYRDHDADTLRAKMEPSEYERADGHPVGQSRSEPAIVDGGRVELRARSSYSMADGY